MHAGVSLPVLNLYCTAHFFLSVAFVVIYATQVRRMTEPCTLPNAIAAVRWQVVEPLPTLRTLSWALRTAVQVSSPEIWIMG